MIEMNGNVQNMENLRCKIILENFEGPLDLLLYLIRKDEIDIYDIPISYVTKQYISYLDFMRELNLEIAGEYLYIASVLVNIKARMLLPKPGIDGADAEDPREELTELLVEYQQFRNAGEFLKIKFDREKNRYHLSSPIVPGYESNIISIPLDFVELMRTGWDILKKHNRVLKPPPREEIDIAERIEFISRRLAAKERLTFLELFERKNVSGILFVGTFFALLELIRQKKIYVRQRNPFGNIWIYQAKAN
ncbi:segregation/condensation protein A [bacterium]|nr:MAG: segregation/condensation protein A [bacterium]